MSTVTEIEKLLTEVKGIVEKHKKVDEMTGKNFNIFKVCEIDEKEVLICRFIYQLINPKGLHNQGDVFLRKFITDVLGGVIGDSGDGTNNNQLIITENELSNVRVYKEFVIENNKRIDLLIETDKHTIPIEVKIYAGDQENQCNDYLKYSKNSKLYYLTLFGDPPSDFSYKYESKTSNITSYEDGQEQKIEEIKNIISCISFRDDIIPWIEDCIKDTNIIGKKQIVDNLMQFFYAVRGVCNMGDNELNIELIEKMKENDNFLYYVEMTKCQSAITSEVLKSIIDKLNKWAIDKYGKDSIDSVYIKDKYESEIANFCSGGRVGNNIPGFGIFCKRFDLSICIEATKKDGMYYGVYIRNEAQKQDESFVNKIKGIINYSEGRTEYGWPFWDYLIPKGASEAPNFVEPNESFAKLLGKNDDGEDNIDCFVKDIEKKLTDLINIFEIQ